MPRKPTGRGRGRPKGSGQLGEEGVDHVRLTVRLPRRLYDALEALAEREHYTREAPELARCVREALEHYLGCPQRRQTGIVPQVSTYEIWLTGNVPEPAGENIRRPEIGPTPSEQDKVSIEPATEPSEDNPEELENTPAYDATRFYLGKLCPKKHEHGNTGQSLLLKRKGRCRECERESDRNRPSRKKKV